MLCPASLPGPTSVAIAALALATFSAAAAAPERPVLSGRTDSRELERKAMVERMDRHGLRMRNTAIVETTPDFLRPPPDLDLSGFGVARTAPEVEFAIVPVEPRFLNEQPKPDMHVGVWSSWGQGAFDSHTGRLYGAVGNHVFYDARIHLVEYDTATRTVRTLPDVNRLLGRAPEDFGDGKIHGSLDFWNGRSLWFMTYWCAYPEPSEEQFASGYEGGRLLSWDVDTEKLTDHGTPFPRSSWPLHRVDVRHGLMFAVGALNEFLCYDLTAGETRYAGHPPDGMRWHERCLLVDETTGCAYTSNRSPADPDVHIVRYDSRTNRFRKMKSQVPPNAQSGKREQIRAWSQSPRGDGWFLCIAMGGEMFRFWPEKDRVEDLGLCWAGDHDGLYTTSIAMTSDGKYAYYVPGAHGRAHKLGTPVVQYNTRTGERKALAFLFPHVYGKYGYIPSGCFSVSLDPAGERLLMIFNGAFKDVKVEEGDVFGDPSVIVLHIPEAERP